MIKRLKYRLLYSHLSEFIIHILSFKQSIGLSRQLKSHSVFFHSIRYVILSIIISFLVYEKGTAQITFINNWLNVYHDTSTEEQNINYIVPVGSNSNRVLIVAIASSRADAGARDVNITYGGQTPTSSVGDMETSSIQHSAIYYFDESKLDAATNNILSVTVSSGTTTMTDVFVTVLDGVDQTNPVTDSQNYNSGATAVDPFQFSPALTVNTNDRAVEIISTVRTGNSTPRTISSYPSNWTRGANEQTVSYNPTGSANDQGIRNAVANRSVPTSNTTDGSSVDLNGSARASMTAISFKSQFNYCTPNYATGTVEGDYIARVQLGDINNVTLGSLSPYYTYYSSLSTDLTLGNSYSISVRSGTYSSANNISVWIDFNQNETFESSEKLGNVTLPGNSTGTINFTVPGDAVTGITRMRVREAWNETSMDGCTGYTYGETEDYNVNIVSSCNDATLTLNTSNSDQTVCVQQPITEIRYTVGGSATGAGVSGLPAGVSGNFSGGLFTINGSPTVDGTFIYTVTTNGTPSGCSETTATGTITVNSLPTAPSANNVTTIYNGILQEAGATVGTGEEVLWFTSATGGSAATAPSAINAGTYTAWAEARNIMTGCVSAIRTQVTLVINKKNLQITATAPNIVYGDEEPAVIIQYSGFAGTDNASVLDNTGFTTGTDYIQGNSAGIYNTTIVLGSATDNNYNFSPLNTSTFLVDKKVLNVTAGNQTVSYGTHDGIITQNGTYSFSGFDNGDNTSVINGINTISFTTNYTETSNAGTLGIVITPEISGLNAVNYSFNAVNGIITITKANQYIICDCVPFTKPLNEFDTIPIGATSSSGLPVTITMLEGSAATLNGSPGNYYLTDIGITGSVTLYANQAGDNNYNPAAQATRYFDVTKSNQNISFPAIDNLTYFTGLTLELEAVATSGLEVSYIVVSGPATVTGNILSINGTGEVWIRANQDGNESFNVAASIVRTFTVNKGPQTITINIPSEPLTESTQITASSTSGLPVTLTLGTGSAAASLNFNSGGGYYTLSGINGSGNIDIVGNQSGDDNFLQADQVIQTIDISKLNQTITFNPIENHTYSPVLTVTLAASASSGLGVTYSVISGPATLSGNTLTITGAGTVTVDASQSGDGTYNPAPTVTLQFEVLKATPVIIQPDITKSFDDPSFTLSPTSASTGSFSFLSGNDNIFTISGNIATIVGTGNTTLDIEQQPTANYNGATKTIIFSVSKTTSAISVTGLTEYTYDATHKGPSTSVVSGSTGTVTYSYSGSGTTIYGPSYTKPLNAGTYQVTATVAADANYSPATSEPYMFTILKADALISITPYEVIYDGVDHSAVGTAVGVSVESLSGLDLSGTVHKNAGVYNNDIWTFTDITGNYNNASGTINNIINQKALSITASDQFKCFGEIFTFDGDEFTSSGLVNPETIGNVTVNSSGALSDAVAGSYIITASNASGGTFNPSNYSITYIDGEMLVNPIPTLTGAVQDVPVCEGNPVSILLSGLLANSAFNLSYTINNIAQSEITGLVADAAGNSVFITPALMASDNGKALKINSITVTSLSPSCSNVFSQEVNLVVNPLPTLSGAVQASAICENNSATVNLTGLVPGTTFTLSYTINGGAPILVTGLTSDAFGNSGFTTSILTASNDGQTLQITGIEDESTGCTQVFNQNLILEVDAAGVGGTATATDALICENSSTTIVLTGYTGTELLWQQSPDGTSNWINVIGGSGERTNIYVTPNLTTDTYYRALVTNGVCAIEFSSVASVNVNPLPTLTGAAQETDVCHGSPGTINLSGLLPNATMSLEYTIDNGAPVLITGLTSDGSGNSSFVTSTLTEVNDGQILQITGITITSEIPYCFQSFSQDVILTVIPLETVGVSISADPSNIVCEGTNVTFTATPVNGGSNPIYQWKVNGINVGTNSDLYSYEPENGDQISCILTSDLQCVTGSASVPITYFSWDDNTKAITDSDIGLDAISIGGGQYLPGGIGGTTALGPITVPKTDINLNLGNNPAYNTDGVDYSISYRRAEGVGQFFTRENSLIISGGSAFNVSYRIDDGAGSFTSVTSSNFSIADDSNFHNYRFTYNPSDGYGRLYIDGAEVWTSSATPGKPMYWTGAGDLIVGANIDASGNSVPTFDNLSIKEISLKSATDEVTIIVNPLPVISTQPSSLTLCEGESGNFTVVTSASSPTYQWFYSIPSEPTNWLAIPNAAGVIQGATTDELQILVAAIAWTGYNVSCLITANGCETRTSAVLLTVNPFPATGEIIPD